MSRAWGDNVRGMPAGRELPSDGGRLVSRRGPATKSVKKPARRRILRAALCLLAVAALWSSLARAQGGGHSGGGHSGGGPGGFPAGHPGFPGGQPRFPGTNPPVGTFPGRGGANQPSSRHPLQQGPGGRWWDVSRYAKSVGLSTEQRGRMDNAFEENRPALTSGLDSLRKAQDRLDALERSDHPSEAALLAEIQNVAQARADLQKTNTHLLLQLRNELTAEQLDRLERLK